MVHANTQCDVGRVREIDLSKNQSLCQIQNLEYYTVLISVHVNNLHHSTHGLTLSLFLSLSLAFSSVFIYRLLLKKKKNGNFMIHALKKWKFNSS